MYEFQQLLRPRLSLDQRLDDLAVGLPSDIGDMVAQAYVTGLHLVVHLALGVYDLPVETVQSSLVLPQRGLCLVRHEAFPDELLCQEGRYPLGVAHVRLSSRQLLDQVGVDQYHVEVHGEDAPEGFPVDARALHGHAADTGLDQQVPQPVQFGSGHTELGLNFFSICFQYTRKDTIFVYIKSTYIVHKRNFL